MKLREEEFYEQYHQHGGTTIIPTEIFNELYDDATEEIERLYNIIKEVREYIENDVEVYYVLDTRLNKAFDKTKKVKKDLLEILDKGSDKE